MKKSSVLLLKIYILLIGITTSSLNLWEKVRLVRQVLIMHYLMFTILTLTGFQGVLMSDQLQF